MAEWKTKLAKEFQMAEAARARGNEGQARVCARRAAGVAIREYMTRHGIQVVSPSAVELLKTLVDLPDVSAVARSSAAYLTLRVDEGFKLPPGVDLIREAHLLCEQLLPDEVK